MICPRTSILEPPLVARSGHTLHVLAICRISTVNQDHRSLADQEASYRAWLDAHTDIPYEMEVVASQGSGEQLDRADYLRAIELVNSGQFDLVISEDLGRICRRVHAYIFCETCEDADTRLIAINDHVDTGRDDWRLSSFFAVMRHESYNRDTAQRIRRSHRNRFMQGGVFQHLIYGYIKPHANANDADVTKDPVAERVYEEWFRKLEDGASFAEVADWLNDRGIPTGPASTATRWTGPYVGRVTRNPILKGVRVRNRVMAKRVNSTGRRKAVKAPPEELLERECPHLAFIEPERYDRVIRMLDERNAKYRRGRKSGHDSRLGQPKKRTRWPGQHVQCGICGRLFVYGGHGQTNRLMCSGAREHKCWNGVTIDGPFAARAGSSAVFDAIANLPDCEPELMRLVEEEAAQFDATNRGQLDEINRKLLQLDRPIGNVVAAIREMGGNSSLSDELSRLEDEKRQLLLQRDKVDQQPKPIALPPIHELRRLAHDSVAELAIESPEFGRAMQRLIPRLEVFPYRLIDGGHVELRARIDVDLASFVPAAELCPSVHNAVRTTLWVDLFKPPQREKHRPEVVQLIAAGHSFKQASQRLGITSTAAQRAGKLQRLMDARGIADPFQPVHEPPRDYTKLSRHRHSRYQFAPLPGYPNW